VVELDAFRGASGPRTPEASLRSVIRKGLTTPSWHRKLLALVS